MKNCLIYSIQFSKTSRKLKKNLPDASLKFITCMKISSDNVQRIRASICTPFSFYHYIILIIFHKETVSVQ